MSRTFQQILEAAGFATRAYAGPFAERSPAIEVDGTTPIGRVMADIVGEIRENADQEAVVSALRRMRQDNLGNDSMLYFPGESFKE